jgi:competence protein ComFC
MTELLDRQNWSIDIVTEVPLEKNRSHERGYNQSKCLAIPLAYYSGLKHSSRILKKVRPTRPQVGLSRAERQINVIDAFNSDSNRVKGLSILIVDDVVTTGATINACSLSLLEAGAANVYGISLARATRLGIE